MVVGILKSNLLKQLQLNTDLTLEKAFMKCLQSEAVKHQQSVVKDKDSTTEPSHRAVEAVIMSFRSER